MFTKIMSTLLFENLPYEMCGGGGTEIPGIYVVNFSQVLEERQYISNINDSIELKTWERYSTHIGRVV